MTIAPLPRLAIATLLATRLVHAPLVAQCGASWQPGASFSGPSSSVYALARAPNGDLFAGGEFDVADTTFAHSVARWDGSTWHALGSGVSGWVGARGSVHAIASMPNGDCIVGGKFASAGGVLASNIARWDGTQWSPLGSGIAGVVRSLLVMPDGDVIAGGFFTQAGSTAVANVARWKGGTWSALGAGCAGHVFCLARLPNGDVIAGGAAGVGGPRLQRWDGSVWTPLFPPMQQVYAAAVAPNGDVFLGGWGGNQLASWNGVSFQTLPGNMIVNALLVDAASGDVIVGGVSGVARWNGSTLSSVTNSTDHVSALAQLANGALVAGGLRSSPLAPRTVRRLRGSTWLTVGAPAPAPIEVHDIAPLANGDMVVGGRFQGLEGVPLANVGRWNGTQWQPLGLGVDEAVEALAVAANGDVIVGGSFEHAGGAPASFAARWNGSTWSALGSGPPGPVFALTTRSNGDIVAQTVTGLVRWNGSTWTSIASGSFVALATLPNDDVVTAGPAGVGTWNGASFAPLGTLPGVVRCLLVRRNGELIVGGEQLDTSSGVTALARWTGSAWVPVGPTLPSIVYAITELPNSDLLVSATLWTPGLPTALTRWNGAALFDLAANDGVVLDVAVDGRGELFAGGWFSHVGGAIAANFARSTPSCPASTSSYGVGCTGGAGPVTLAASSLPWAGATFVGTAHGMAPLSLALHVVGVGALAQPLPLGAPGCGLFVAPILTDVLFPTGGQVATALAIPNLPSLAGAQLRTQVVGLELDSTLALLRTTSTNALLLTIGAL